MENEQLQGESRTSVLFTILLDDMWRGLKRFYHVFLVIVLVFSAGAFLREKANYKPYYQAYTSFVVKAKTAYGYNESYYNRSAATQMSKTFPYILTSGALQKAVMEDLGLSSLPGTITASALPDMALFTMQVTAADPQTAYDILQSVIRNYPKVSEYITGDTQLTLLDDSGVPQAPMNPENAVSAAVKGGKNGLLVCAGLLLLYGLTRNTVRREDDLKKRASVACLGSVPLLPAKKRTGRQKQRQILIDRRDGGSAFGESIRVIRTRIVRALEQKKTRRLLVTSAVQGEGKTTVAVNLAIALARQGRRVVLVDGDLRNPSVHTTLGMKKQGGIAEVLEGKLPLEDALTDYGNTGLSVLPGSAPRKDPISLLGGGGLAEMLDTLARTFEYVIVDAPPCGFLPDAAMLARQADGVISVVRQDYARVERILAAINHISETDTAYLGYVFNGVQAGIADGYGYGYGYRYGYGYGSRKKDGGHSAGNEM